MEKNWDIKFKPFEAAMLTKSTGETVKVQIESLATSEPGKPMFNVREVISRIGYPAMQSELKKIKP